MTRTWYAAIGTDGTSPVVWGLMHSPDAARREAARFGRDNGITIGPLSIQIVTDQQARHVLAGVVACDAIPITLTPDTLRELRGGL